MRTIGTEKPDTQNAVILGVETHLEFHVAVAVDHLGRRLGEASVPTTAKGYGRLLSWAEAFGPVRCAGLEGTSSYGTGLARQLRINGIEVLEVERPKRRRRSEARDATSRKVRPPTPKLPHERFWPEKPRACPRRAPMGAWR